MKAALFALRLNELLDGAFATNRQLIHFFLIAWINLN